MMNLHVANYEVSLIHLWKSLWQIALFLTNRTKTHLLKKKKKKK